MHHRISLIPVTGLPLLRDGDDVPTLVMEALARIACEIQDDDIVVVAQKIVSKAEGRRRLLSTVCPTEQAHALGRAVLKDARLVQLILDETVEVLRAVPNVLVVRTRKGMVLANAGIDASNVDPEGGDDVVLLRPRDPDASAATLREALQRHSGRRLAVIINDSIGRAWLGTIGTAVGVAGMTVLADLRGRQDLTGRALRTTEVGLADEVAAAAFLVQGQSNEGLPVVIVRGLKASDTNGRATDLVRPRKSDLFQ